MRPFVSAQVSPSEENEKPIMYAADFILFIYAPIMLLISILSCHKATHDSTVCPAWLSAVFPDLSLVLLLDDESEAWSEV